MLHEIRTLTFLSIKDVTTILHLAIDAIEQSEGILGFSQDEPFMSMNDVLEAVDLQLQFEIDEMTFGYIKDRAMYLQRLKDIQHCRVKQC